MTDAETLSDGTIIALADGIPESVNLLDTREVLDCIILERCVELNVRQSLVEPHIHEITAVALARRLGAFA